MSRPRTPGLVYGAIFFVLVVLVSAFALTQRTPPPPTIAEFAPQAVENITDAPNDQSSSSGRAGGAGAGGLETPSPPPEEIAQIDVPRVRRCVGDPPRQIEDPQSPPCVPYWKGDNAGATSRGVTRDEIIIVPNNANNDTNQGVEVNLALQQFFNSRFEFYGRKLVFKPPVNNQANAGNCEQRKAGAVGIVQQVKAFAYLNRSGGAAACFFDEAARLHLIAVEVGGVMSEKDLTAGRPYLWQYGPGMDEMFTQWGRWACRRLAGKNAEHATDLGYRQVRRKFGLLMQAQGSPYAVDTAPLKGELASCGEQLAFEDVAYDTDQDNNTRTTNDIVQMRDEGITTAFIMSGGAAAATIVSSASSQGYFPEWVLNDGLNLDYSRNWVIHGFWSDSSQRASLAGLMVAPEQVPYSDVALNWALAEVDPGFQFAASTNMHAALKTYWALLLLASGIQMAGPNLTPATFEKALQRTSFPNPSLPPLQEGWVGFPGGSHAMIHDAAAVWWSETASSPYPDEGVGAWCYAEGGRRYKTGDWTDGPDQLFTDVCDTYSPGLRRNG